MPFPQATTTARGYDTTQSAVYFYILPFQSASVWLSLTHNLFPILMPAYFFHIVFELCPNRPPTTPTVFTPPPLTDIFASELPIHRTTPWPSFTPQPHTGKKTLKLGAPPSETHNRSAPQDNRSPVQNHRLPRRPSNDSHQGSPVPQTKGKSGHRRVQSSALKDWRFDITRIQSIDMVPGSSESRSLKHPSRRASTSVGLATKGKFIPSDLKDTDVGWGVVHLYRDGQETPGLYDEPGRSIEGSSEKTFNEEDCTTLCILAVPSYMTPSDFLGFVGEQTREEVSHFRLIRTSRANKYMVLMKFRDAKRAREWRKEWNEKPFNSMEVRGH